MNLPVAAYFAASSGERITTRIMQAVTTARPPGTRVSRHGLYRYYQLMARLRIDLFEERLIPATPMPQ